MYPLLGSLSLPDFVYVVNVVLSLLAILFMFDAVCGERESGTLGLVLSNAVPRHALLLGKWIGGYLTLLVPFLLAVAGGLVYAASRGALEAGQLPRVVLLVVVACLYVAVFFNMSLFISTTTRRPATSLLVCLLVWVVSTLAIPNLAPVTAKILEPTPSLEKIRAEKAAVDREIDLKLRRLTLTSGELSYGRKIELAQENLNSERERRKKRWDEYYEETRARQVRLAETLGRLSPSACWTYAATALADTGAGAYEGLRGARKKLGEDLNELWDDLLDRRRKHPESEWPEITADEIPRLRVAPPRVGEAVRRALNDVLILGVLNVIFFMLAFAFFLRYDVR
jgi:ABC-type transport system involved in multi-copper enzyme maturation permease subunit